MTPNHTRSPLSSPDPDATDPHAVTPHAATPHAVTPHAADPDGADLPGQHAALDADLDDLQRRLSAALELLRDHPESDASSLATLHTLLTERQRLLTQQAALWMRWRALGGQLLWVPPPAQAPRADSAHPSSATKHAATHDAAAHDPSTAPQRVPIRVLHKPAPASPPAPSPGAPSPSVIAAPAPPPSPQADAGFTITDDLRASLQDALANTLDTRPSAPSITHDLDILTALLRLAGAPVFLSFDTLHQQPSDLSSRLREEVTALQRVSEPHPLASLQRLSRTMQTHFLSMIIARLRNLQDLPGHHHPTVSGIFPHLETYSRLHQPGPINGFSRKHNPLRGSWLKDARFHHQKLSDLLNPTPDLSDNPEHLLTEIASLLASLPPPASAHTPAGDTPTSSDDATTSPPTDPPTLATLATLNAACKRFIHIASDNDPRLLRLLADHTDLLTGKPRKRIKKSLDRAQHLAASASSPASPSTAAPDASPALTDPANPANPADPANPSNPSYTPPPTDPADPPDLALPPTDDLDAPDFLSRWPWRAQTEGKRAVIVGGEDQREDIRARAAAAFSFSSLEWHPANHPKRLETLAKRVKQGSLDLVILLKRFISHRVEDILVKPCKKHGVRYLYLEQGYSPEQLRRAIERHIPPTPPTPLT